MRSSCARRESEADPLWRGVIVLADSSQRRGRAVVEVRLTAPARRLSIPLQFSGGGSRGGNKFVALDFRSDARAAIRARFYAHHLAAAVNIHVTGLRERLWKSQHELEFAAHVELFVGHKIQAAITDVAGQRAQFVTPRSPGKDAHRKHHHESPRYATLGSIGHSRSSDGNLIKR